MWSYESRPDTPVPLTTKIMLHVSAYLIGNEVLEVNTMYACGYNEFG